MKVSLQWQGEMAFLAETASGHRVAVDAAPEVGGADRGPRPMELVLVALGGCTGLDVVSVLRKMRQPLAELILEIEGRRAPEHPKVYTEIAVRYRLKGEGLDPEKVARAVRLSAERYCSVGNMLNRVARLRYEYEVNGQRFALEAPPPAGQAQEAARDGS